jgi:hypothetical protein
LVDTIDVYAKTPGKRQEWQYFDRNLAVKVFWDLLPSQTQVLSHAENIYMEYILGHCLLQKTAASMDAMHCGYYPSDGQPSEIMHYGPG